MPVPDSIKKLVDTFAEHLEHYKSTGYNETEVRREFLDPFWKALGWDVDNAEGYADAYKDVIHEDAIDVDGQTKAPDYSFRIGGTRKFFLEAKKPSVNLKDDIAPAFQLRRYAWSAKLPLSVLSDFEEFAAYDCRFKPFAHDNASKGRTLYYTFDQYEDKWEEIEEIFSRDAVLRGSFDKYVEDNKKKRGTTEVDDDFLKEIERWREVLAKNLALRNGTLTVRDLNFAVQKIIDRIIFLRICEDRGTEDYGRLQKIAKGKDAYPRLLELFTHADQRYNSGLFHLADEKGRPGAPDTLTPGLTIDDKTVKDIVTHLYYPDSPYAFSVFTADILGQVYEQFLGKTIQLGGGEKRRSVKIEEKPEVRKAGGVYYTPGYIVDYIVENTLGRLLNGDDAEKKNPISVRKAAELKVLDPACGSGSFLIVAYQYLLDWHRDQYTLKPGADPASGTLDQSKIKRHAAGKSPKIYQAKGDEWKLTTEERKRILLNNIHGVDIDSQAVEVTKLSLLLKVLEGETDQVNQRDLFKDRERILPDLGNNIQCGNSLIGPDFYAQPDLPDLDDDTRYRINVFDWKSGFKEVFAQGGFDCVIGNPPYIPPELLTEVEKAYFRSHHSELTRKYDTAIVFILRFLDLLSKNGLLSYISSITWQTGSNYAAIREVMLDQHGLIRLVNLPFDIFKDAYVDTCVYVLSKAKQSSYEIFNFPKKARILACNDLDYTKVPISLLDTDAWRIVLNPDAERILNKMHSKSPNLLGDITFSTQGLAGNRFETSSKANSDFEWPYLLKGQAQRFELIEEHICFTSLDDKLTLKRFYEAEPKLLIRRVISRQDRLLSTFCDQKLVTKKDINPFVFESADLAKFVLGIMNSKLISWIYVQTSSIATKDDFRQTTLTELRNLPIRPIDFENPDDVASHDKMVALVDTMLDLHQRKADEKNPDTLRHLETQITATDSQIDQLVYSLYDLTADEIALVEASAKSA